MAFLFPNLSRATALVLGFAFIPHAMAAEVEEDWRRITTLDAGPQVQTRSATEGRAAALAHLDLQEKALRAFLIAHPKDEHAFEGRLRLSRLLQIRGSIQGSVKTIEEGKRLLDQLDASPVTPEQRSELDFSRISLLMRGMRGSTPESRERLLNATRKFQRAHPDDRRLPALLVEVAGLFSLQPKTMRTLLSEAEPNAKEDDLKARIGDDLKRLDLLGHPLPFQSVTPDGKPLDIAQFRGSVVLLVFFARWSQPSLDALDVIKRAAAQFPGASVQLVGVSLDPKPEMLAEVIKEKAITWPVAFDGKGWESPLIRSLGINAVPTVWLLDREGHLRSLNALESTAGQIGQLTGR
ncbi:MAG: resA 2 [Chthoniobacteraceae bacterium]|nr:resA 2 [Chthoniobacteraceae bacterium]